MKLLGWMHRKFRQNSGDVLKDFPTGPTCNCLSGRPSPEDHHQQLSPLPAIPSRTCHPMKYEAPLPSDEEYFVLTGLLSIGTLGAMPIEEEQEQEYDDNDDDNKEEEEKTVQQSVPAAASVEAIAEKEETDTATETDLMVVSAELEKILIAETERKGGTNRLSSARPSSVGRKAAATDCPLQDYLFGSTMEVHAEGERREKRSSLGELFLKEEEDREGKRERGREAEEEKEEKSAAMGVQLVVKKMLKRHRSGKGSRRTSGGGGDGDATTTAKFHKIMQMFHRKVHPDQNSISSTPRKTTKSSSKHERKDHEGNYSLGTAGSSSTASMKANSKRDLFHNKDGNADLIKCSSDLQSLSLDGCDSMENREYWIKTDADYLVLEL